MAAMVALAPMAMERSQYTSVPVAEISLTYLGESSDSSMVVWGIWVTIAAVGGGVPVNLWRER